MGNICFKQAAKNITKRGLIKLHSVENGGRRELSELNRHYHFNIEAAHLSSSHSAATCISLNDISYNFALEPLGCQT